MGKLILFSKLVKIVKKIVTMAKSIRSKWKRKMRDIKRERYAQKELVKLKECAERLQKTKDSGVSPAMVEDSGLFTLVSSKPLKEQEQPTTMEITCTYKVESTPSTSTTKTAAKTNQNGQYPVWMSIRQVKRLKKKNEKKKVQKKKNKAKN